MLNILGETIPFMHFVISNHMWPSLQKVVLFSPYYYVETGLAILQGVKKPVLVVMEYDLLLLI